MSRTYNTVGIVLKRRNYGEADRLVTILTRDYGKVTVLAKGVRKINSKRSGSIEPGTKADFQVIKGRGMDLLAQAKILDSYAESKNGLIRMTQLYQWLEIVELLTAEDQEQAEVFDLADEVLTKLSKNGNKKVALVNGVGRLLTFLGFLDTPEVPEERLKLIIEELINQPLKAKRFLTVKAKTLKL